MDVDQLVAQFKRDGHFDAQRAALVEAYLASAEKDQLSSAVADFVSREIHETPTMLRERTKTVRVMDTKLAAASKDGSFAPARDTDAYVNRALSGSEEQLDKILRQLLAEKRLGTTEPISGSTSSVGEPIDVPVNGKSVAKDSPGS